jgi:hypothetical protein
MTDETDKAATPEWKLRPTGLYVPDGTPDGGKRPVVGFARGLTEDPKAKDGKR